MLRAPTPMCYRHHMFRCTDKCLFPLCSGVGKEEKHTREGYKTGQKRQAFKRLEEVGDNLNVHMQVVQRAKEE
jgi:hypothetical protein